MAACDTCRIIENKGADACAWSDKPGGLAITRRALEICPIPAAARILDIACGLCGTIDFLHTQSCGLTTGSDISFETLRNMRSRQTGLPLVQADGARLPFGEATFDAVFVECALSILNTGRVLEECRRLLKPAARLVLNDVYVRNGDDGDVKCLAESRCLSGLMTQAQIFARLAENRFHVDAWEDHSQVIAPWLAQKIFNFGSLDRFYHHLRGTEAEMDDFKTSIKRLRLGYYLLIAEKTA